MAPNPLALVRAGVSGLAGAAWAIVGLGKPAEAAHEPAANSSSAAQAEAPSLYQLLGGEAAVEAAVDIFYVKVLADPLLAPFFEGVDMAKQRKHQIAFMTYAFGGSKGYSGRSLEVAHKRLIEEKGLGLVHFDAVAGHLVQTLKELSVPEDLIGQAAAIVMTTRPIFDPSSRKPSSGGSSASAGIEGAAGAAEAEAPSLYQRIGGEGAVEAAVDVFYGKVLADPLLVPFFEGVDMAKQRKHQVAFMTYAFGGSKGYSGRSLAVAHKRLIAEKGLGLAHFDAVAGHLVQSLKELSVPEDLIGQAAAIVMTTRPIFDPNAPRT